jgi:succinate dehydrogenase/fumarate reductase flavoprotein subunit
VLATGGCGASQRWRDTLAGFPLPHFLSFEGNQGDALEAAISIGADIDRNHRHPFFWMPASLMPWAQGARITFPHVRDRAKPGLIAVDITGRRFVNESNSYHDFVEVMLRQPERRAFLLCDRAFVQQYGIGAIRPVWQNLRYYISNGYLIAASSIAELAGKLNMDANVLADTIAAHNAASLSGVDTFGRGSTAQNRFGGDPANLPNPCLRPIEKAPFIALPVHPAPIGSSVGLRTDANGRVLQGDGSPIQALYACGNDMASMMKGHYPGPGITLGPALVFAYRAAMHAAGRTT